jgi:hypothetical protein
VIAQNARFWRFSEMQDPYHGYRECGSAPRFSLPFSGKAGEAVDPDPNCVERYNAIEASGSTPASSPA